MGRRWKSRTWIKEKKALNREDPIVKEKLDKYEKMTKELMLLHGVSHYKFKWNYCVETYIGYCSPDSISLSIYYVLRLSEDEIRNIILHEIAHAAVGWGNCHREIWQIKAKELGVTWTRRYHKT